MNRSAQAEVISVLYFIAGLLCFGFGFNRIFGYALVFKGAIAFFAAMMHAAKGA